MRALWRWLRGHGASSEAPERLISLPGQLREPSSELLARLRAMDDRAEVVYVGQGRWWVGRVKPNSPRRATGRQLALAIREGDGFGGDQWPELRQALLMAQGFGLVVDVTVQGEPDAVLVREFALAMYVERGGTYLSDEEQQHQRRRRDRISEHLIRERDLSKWLYSRSPYGRGNPWVSMSTARRSA